MIPKGFSYVERAGAQAVSGQNLLSIPALNSLTVRSLVGLFDEKANLFCGRAVWKGGRVERSLPSRRSTMIASMGLQRLLGSGSAIPFDLVSIGDGVLKDTSWINSAGDLGLLIWFTALCHPESLDRIVRNLDLKNALNRYRDGRWAETQGLAWFLSGLAHARAAGSGDLLELTDVAVEAYRLLLNNQKDIGMFGGAAAPAFPQGIFRKRFASFGEQIYSIYALATFAQAFDVEEPLGPALHCANSLRALQGQMGEWWFLYDTYTRCVRRHYPVFSFQQAGLGPAGLQALAEATGQDFDEPIRKGLSWVSGANELGVNLLDVHHGVIWDSIGFGTLLANYGEALLGLVKVPGVTKREKLAIRYEARPDHLGWILYACGGSGLPDRCHGEAIRNVTRAQ
jgi:hypothetical protein